MSGISTAYNALLSRVEAVLDVSTNRYYRLSNPYQVDENTEQKLQKGYGLAVLPSENANLELCKITPDRVFEIVLTRLYTGDDDSALNKSATELLLLEDEFLIINDLEQDSSLNTQTIQASYVSDSGIEFVAGETGRFFMIRIQINVKYSDIFT